MIKSVAERKLIMKKSKIFGSILALTLALVPTVGTVASNNSTVTNSITASAANVAGCYRAKYDIYCYNYSSWGGFGQSYTVIPRGSYISISCERPAPALDGSSNYAYYYWGHYNGHTGYFKKSDIYRYA